VILSFFKTTKPSKVRFLRETKPREETPENTKTTPPPPQEQQWKKINRRRPVAPLCRFWLLGARGEPRFQTRELVFKIEFFHTCEFRRNKARTDFGKTPGAGRAPFPSTGGYREQRPFVFFHVPTA
jgi:hypothetical protein